MSRSVWKMPFISPLIFFRIWGNPKRKDLFFCRNRDTTITNLFLKIKFRVYSGNSFKTFSVVPPMLGHKLGEFAFTKIRGAAITDSLVLRNKLKRKEKVKIKRGK